jgi:radical SAM protein with 4Fe4S-binding SPASM domain
MEQLVIEHYLVSEDYDEHQQVEKLRAILRNLNETYRSKDIIGYTILPTTACNARCYYCFEQGCKVDTMTAETANAVVDYIASNCGEDKQIEIMWFGGEPTIATNRIDQICKGLETLGIRFFSRMSSNGYLFDENMVIKAKALWKLQEVQVCVDGTEDSYNKTKAYVNVSDNPYQRVIRNIGLLINDGIRVRLRMNFDLGNYHEFSDLLDEIVQRYGGNKYLRVYAHPIVGSYVDYAGRMLHGSDDWFASERWRLNSLARDKGLQGRKQTIPTLSYTGCEACDNRCVVITPSGKIVKCAEQFGDDQVIGDVYTGIVNLDRVHSWERLVTYPICEDCALLPNCFRLMNCGNKGYCHKSLDYLMQYRDRIIAVYNDATDKKTERGVLMMNMLKPTVEYVRIDPEIITDSSVICTDSEYNCTDDPYWSSGIVNCTCSDRVKDGIPEF